MVCMQPFYAQESEYEKHAHIFTDAILHMENKAYHEALPLIKELLNIDPNNSSLNYIMGYCVFNSTTHKAEAIPYLEKAVIYAHKHYNMHSYSESNAPFESYYYLARAYHIANQMDNAKFYYNLFVQKVSKKHQFYADAGIQILNCTYAKELMNTPIKLEVNNLGENVNSPYPDFSPVVSLDEKTIYFTSRRLRADSSNKFFTDPANGLHFEDIYVSIKDENGDWKPTELVHFSRKDNHDATINLKHDNSTLYIYRDDKGDGNLYESEWDEEEQEWMDPGRILGSHINTKSQETHMSLTEDDQIMYFVSDRPGGFGGKDIYRCIMMSDEEWSEPMNLGSTINTSYDEDGPFISPDGKVIYFSSKGHRGMGGYDIFYSEKQEDGKWSKPENLGYPINSTDEDVFFVVSKDGQRAYYSSEMNKGGYGEKDIYMINHLEAVKKELALIKGFVKVANPNNFPDDVVIYVRESETGEMRQLVRPQDKDGSFIFLVLPGYNYDLSYNQDGEEFHNESIKVPYGTAFNATKEIIYLRPVAAKGVETVIPPQIIDKKEEKQEISPETTTQEAGKNTEESTETTTNTENKEETAENKTESSSEDKTESTSESNTTSSTTTSESTSAESTSSSNASSGSNKVEFKVQIGAFRNLDHDKLSAIYAEIEGFEQIESGEFSILTIGSYSTYKKARKYRDYLRKLGVGDAFVVAFYQGKKVTVDKAKEILKSKK